MPFAAVWLKTPWASDSDREAALEGVVRRFVGSIPSTWEKPPVTGRHETFYIPASRGGLIDFKFTCGKQLKNHTFPVRRCG